MFSLTSSACDRCNYFGLSCFKTMPDIHEPWMKAAGGRWVLCRAVLRCAGLWVAQ